MVVVGVVSSPALVSVICAANIVMAMGLITWLQEMAIVPKVVMGLAREALVLWPTVLARLGGMVPVTLLRVVKPMVFFTIDMVMVGFIVDTVTGVTRQIHLSGHGIHL